MRQLLIVVVALVAFTASCGGVDCYTEYIICGSTAECFQAWSICELNNGPH